MIPGTLPLIGSSLRILARSAHIGYIHSPCSEQGARETTEAGRMAAPSRGVPDMIWPWCALFCPGVSAQSGRQSITKAGHCEPLSGEPAASLAQAWSQLLHCQPSRLRVV
jgi:hypothetical protein